MSLKLAVFTLPTCAPCKSLKPVMHELVQELDIDVDRVDITTPEGKAHAEKYNINSYPTMFVIKDDTIIDVLKGFKTDGTHEEKKEALKSMLNRYFK